MYATMPLLLLNIAYKIKYTSRQPSTRSRTKTYTTLNNFICPINNIGELTSVECDVTCISGFIINLKKKSLDCSDCLQLVLHHPSAPDLPYRIV